MKSSGENAKFDKPLEEYAKTVLITKYYNSEFIITLVKQF